MKIRGATAVVTGASSAFGRRVAERLAEKGAKVGLLGRDPARLDEAATSCRALGVEAAFAAGDVGDADYVGAAFSSFEEKFGPVDIVVNVAGISQTVRSNLEDIDPTAWDRMIATNVRGTYLTCRRALPGMKARQRGAIVNIGSTGAHIARPRVSLYAASKFAVRALTDSLIEECNGTGVRVCLVSAGPINTPFWQTFTEPMPMEPGQMLQVDDLADAILWLIERPANVRVDEILLRPYTPTPATAREPEFVRREGQAK